MLPFIPLVCSATAAVVVATSTTVPPPLGEVDEVIVTGHKEVAAALDETLGIEALAEARGLTLADTLERAPGLRVLRSGNVAKPVIDGFTGSRVLISTDGVRLQSQSWGLEHAPEIDTFGADRIQIIRGAAGIRYGADALGGAILIEPSPLRTDPGIGGEANLIGISNGYVGAGGLSLNGTTPLAPRLAWRANGSYKRGGSSFTPLYDLDNTGVEEVNVGGAVGYLGDRTSLSVSASWFKNRLGVFSGVFAEGPADFFDSLERDVPRNAETFDFSYQLERPSQDVSHLFVRAEAEHHFSDDVALDFLYGFQLNDRKEFDRVRRSTSGAQLLLDLASHSAELTLEHEIGEEISGTLGIAGLYQHNDHEGRRLIPDYDLWNGAVFLIERYTGEGFAIDLGVRGEATSADTEEPARIAPNQNPPVRNHLDFDAFVVTLGVELWPIKHLTLEARVASATRIPSMNELFIDGPSQGQGTFETGRLDLAVEKTINISTGAAFEHEWFHAGASIYANFIRDYVYFAPLIGPDGEPVAKLTIAGAFPAFEYRNVDVVQVSGDVELAVHPWSPLELLSRASFVRARNVSDGEYLVFIPPDRFENRLTFRPVGFDPFENSRAWIESVVTLRQTRIDLAADFSAPPKAYHLLNCGIGTTVELGLQPIEVSLEIRNLLNTRYRDYLSRLRYYADEPGISALLRLRVPFEMPWGG